MSASVTARRFGFGRRGEYELHLEILGQRQVEEHVERILALFLRDVRHGALDELPRARGGGRSRRATTCHTNTNERPLRVGDLLAHLVADGWIAQPLRAIRARAGQRVAERRHLVEQERVESSEKCAPCRFVANIGCTSRPRRRAACANSRLRDQPSGAWGSNVSVLRCTGPPRRARHREHELAVGLVVAVEERARDELDRAAADVAQAPTASAMSSSGARVIARHASPVVRDVQLQLARREPDRAFIERGRAPAGTSARSRRSVAARSDASSPITYRRTAQCPTFAPTFTPSRPSSPPRNSPSVPPRKATPARERVGAHAFDPATA